jgi:hypothetical protein
MQLAIGNTVIPYEVRTSPRAKRKRIVVTPGRVEVVVPTGTPVDGPQGVRAFVEGRRRWVYDAVREIGEKHREILTQRYASGAKVQYRGRWLLLDVQPADVPAITITCRSRFHVAVPAGSPGDAAAVRAAFDHWLRDRASEDVERLGRLHAERLGLAPVAFRLSDARARWGSCGRNGVVRVHWQLVQAPLGALEYVVAHEVAHLVHRNHGPAFWATLGRTLPDWRERKALLERWEGERRSL